VWQFLHRMAIPPEQGGGFRMHDGTTHLAALLCLDINATASHCLEIVIVTNAPCLDDDSVTHMTCHWYGMPPLHGICCTVVS